jgi:hypothetical protein
LKIQKQVVVMVLVVLGAAGSARAADPNPDPPLHLFPRTHLGAEFEVYSGGISGQHLGAGYDTVTRGDYGVRFTFGFLKALNFSLGYMYSNQTRTLSATAPSTTPGGPPSGTVLLHAANLNMGFGNGEFELISRRHAVFYLSPGVGFERNGARSVTFITPLGTATSPIGAGTAVSFNLGTGVKIYPWKHVGFRMDARDFVSGGGTGNLSSAQSSGIPTQYFGPVPVNNNIVFTLGLIYRIR